METQRAHEERQKQGNDPLLGRVRIDTLSEGGLAERGLAERGLGVALLGVLGLAERGLSVGLLRVLGLRLRRRAGGVVGGAVGGGTGGGGRLVKGGGRGLGEAGRLRRGDRGLGVVLGLDGVGQGIDNRKA